MSPVVGVHAPRGVLYRIGRQPQPLDWPPWERVGSGRFDDPKREFRVLYAARERRACFLETLAPFRTSVDALARLRHVQGSAGPVPSPVVPRNWCQERAVVQIRLGPRQRWLDLRASETREALREELAAMLVELGLPDLDLSGVVGPQRRLTQAIARWACEDGYAGLRYFSRFDPALSLWAVFEGAAFRPAGPPEPIEPDDPDLIAAARRFGLAI